MKRLIVLPLIAAALTGCGDDILDWRNAQLSGGKVYAGGENSPFTGKVTNVPEKLLPIPAEWDDFLVLVNRQLEGNGIRGEGQFGRQLTCNAESVEGVISGPISCFSPSTTAIRWTATFGPDGVVTRYAADGKTVIARREYANGLSNGVTEVFNPQNGEHLALFHNHEGKGEGTQQTWFANGQLKTESTMKAGFREGVLTEWYESGAKQGESHYRNGKPDGSVTVWDEQGNVTAKAEYSNGQKVEVAEPAPLPTANTYTMAPREQCITAWAAAYRAEIGDPEAPATLDQVNEWSSWCDEGKLPERM